TPTSASWGTLVETEKRVSSTNGFGRFADSALASESGGGPQPVVSWTTRNWIGSSTVETVSPAKVRVSVIACQPSRWNPRSKRWLQNGRCSTGSSGQGVSGASVNVRWLVSTTAAAVTTGQGKFAVPLTITAIGRSGVGGEGSV